MEEKAPSSFPVEIGQCIGSYRLVGKLGEGGMGVVFDAQHTRLSRRAAIKVLRPQFSQNPEMVARFFTEAESVNVINHPGIVSVFEFGQLPDQTVYIVMEFLQGEALTKRIERCGGRLGLGGLRLMRQVASAVAAAHEHSIVHRDLKPDNVMIISDPDVPGGERAKVVDFGIAKMRQTPLAHLPSAPLAEDSGDLHVTRAGQVMGTPCYMSPDQFQDSGTVTDKADVYSLGVMLYEVLAGRLPFVGQAIADIAAQHQHATPRPLRELDATIPEELAALVARMLAKDPAARPPMAEVAAVLERLVPDPARRSWRKIVLIALLATVLLGGVLGVVGFLLARRTQPETTAVVVTPPPPPPPAPVDLPALRSKALQVLQEGLRDASPEIRVRAAGLVASGRDVRLATLLGPLLGDGDALVQLEVAAGLQRLGARALIPALNAVLQRRDTAELVRVQAAGALVQLGEPAAGAVLRRGLRSPEEAVQQRAARLLAERGERKARELLLQARGADEGRLEALGRLARFGDEEARAVLRGAMAAPAGGAPGELQLRAAAELARGEDPEGLALLERAARQEGALRLLAARLLASLDNPAFYDLLVASFVDAKRLVGERIVAAEGLGACARVDSAPLLAGVLPRSGGSALRLRMAAAGAILEIAASDPELLALDSLKLVESDLGYQRWDERLLATYALGDATPALALPLLRKAIKDPEPEVRRGAAYALGRTRVRAAVPILGEAVDDEVVLVRKEVVRSLGRVGQVLRQRGERVDDVLKVVAPRATRGDALERINTVAALVRLGDVEHKGELQQWLRARDAEVRRQAVGAWAADPRAEPRPLQAALQDRAPAVRLEAAVELAGRGDRAGLATLQAALRRPGAEALRARGALRQLGEEVPGAVELGAVPAEQRAEALSQAPRLPRGEALTLLRGGGRSSDVAVRLQTLEVLGDAPELVRASEGRKLLRALLDDPDARVRSRAGLLTGRLNLRTAPAPGRPPGAAAADHAASARVVVADLAVGPPIDLGSAVDQGRPDQAEPEPAQPHAQAAQERARWFRQLMEQGRAHEDEGRWLQAIAVYEKIAERLPEPQRSALQQSALSEALARVQAHLGRLRVSQMEQGQCQTTELWVMPGVHVLHIGGPRIEVRVRVGETEVVRGCQ